MPRTLILLSLIILSFNSLSCAQEVLPQTSIQGPAPVVLPPMPAELTFAGEAVPLENFDTRESLQRELLTTGYLHARTTLTLLAATRYFPVIEPILRKNGVPDDFKYLCMAESGLNPNAVSPVGAGGLWQFMRATAKEYGLFVSADATVDERFHVEKSTEAACRYILDAKAKSGSWTLAAAAYNAGLGGVATRMQKQGIGGYYDLFLPEETMRYVFRILSFKLIVEDPEAFGYLVAPEDHYPPLTEYTEVSLSDTAIDWPAVARQYGTNYKILRVLNPWIRDYTYNNKEGRTFVLRVPKGDFRLSEL